MADPTPAPTTPAATVAGITTPPMGFTMAEFRALLVDAQVNPDDPAAVGAYINQFSGTGTAQPGSQVLWQRSRSDLSAKAREAGGKNADIYDPYWANKEQGGPGFGETMSTDAAKLDILRWDDTKLQGLADKLIKAHLLDPDHTRDDVEQAWGKLVDKAAKYYDAKVDVTPWDVIDLYGGKGIGGAAGADGSKPTVSKVVQRTSRLSDSTQAWGLLRSMLRSELGRDPSDGEVDDFQAALNEAQRNAPTVTTQTSNTDPTTGNTTVNSETTGGVDESSFAGQYATSGGFEKEHRAYQAATTYANAMMDAIRSPV